jgi:hypothetical protein
MRPNQYPQLVDMGRVFWDTKEYILVDFLLRGKTINATDGIQMLQELLCALYDMHSSVNTHIFQHKNV